MGTTAEELLKILTGLHLHGVFTKENEDEILWFYNVAAGTGYEIQDHLWNVFCDVSNAVQKALPLDWKREVSYESQQAIWFSIKKHE